MCVWNHTWVYDVNHLKKKWNDMCSSIYVALDCIGFVHEKNAQTNLKYKNYENCERLNKYGLIINVVCVLFVAMWNVDVGKGCL